MTINKREIDRLLNTLIGDKLIFMGTTAQDCGAAEGFNKFVESLKKMTKEFCGDKLTHKQGMEEKLGVITELTHLLEGFCRTFRTGLVLNMLTSTKIIKPKLNIVKKVNESKVH